MSETSVDDDKAAAQLSERLRAGDRAGACELVLRSYGPALYRFVYHLAGRRADFAEDAYMDACLELHLHIERYDPTRGSLKTWCYAVARNAFRHRVRAEGKHWRGRSVTDGEASAVAAVALEVREPTAHYLKTAARTGMDRLRAELSAEDQALLSLRVESRMAWNDIAEILREDASEPIAKTASRYRKQFERLLNKLRLRAREEGLVPDDT